MDWVETTGKTVEEAKEAALDVLGVDFNEAQFEVLEEAKSGFLGMSKKPARVRARVKPSTPQAKDTRRQRRKKGGPRGAEQDGATESQEVRVPRQATRPPRQPKVGAQPERNTTVDESGVDNGNMAEDMEPMEELSRMELAVVAQHFLADLLHELELAGTVSVDLLDEETMDLSINGDGLGSLIGARGNVIAAVQELTRAVVQSHAGDGAGRVTVDISGYRKKRREALERFAASVIKEVLETGEERAFEPMIASERKIVHDTVAENPNVASRSEGEEPHRYVVVSKVTSED